MNTYQPTRTHAPGRLRLKSLIGHLVLLALAVSGGAWAVKALSAMIGAGEASVGPIIVASGGGLMALIALVVFSRLVWRRWKAAYPSGGGCGPASSLAALDALPTKPTWDVKRGRKRAHIVLTDFLTGYRDTRSCWATEQVIDRVRAEMASAFLAYIQGIPSRNPAASPPESISLNKRFFITVTSPFFVATDGVGAIAGFGLQRAGLHDSYPTPETIRLCTDSVTVGYLRDVTLALDPLLLDTQHPLVDRIVELWNNCLTCLRSGQIRIDNKPVATTLPIMSAVKTAAGARLEGMPNRALLVPDTTVTHQHSPAPIEVYLPNSSNVEVSLSVPSRGPLDTPLTQEGFELVELASRELLVKDLPESLSPKEQDRVGEGWRWTERIERRRPASNRKVVVLTGVATFLQENNEHVGDVGVPRGPLPGLIPTLPPGMSTPPNIHPSLLARR